MPSYLLRGNCKKYSSGGTSSSCSNGMMCKDTVNFYGSLASKLLTMAESIHTRIENIKKNCGGKPAKGYLIAEIEIPKMVLGVAVEYLEYIKRYGPPDNGIFDPIKLDLLRTQLGITATSKTL